MQALESRTRKPSKQQAESIARSREIEKLEHAMLRAPPRNATTGMRDIDVDDNAPQKKQRIRAKRDGPSRTQLDQVHNICNSMLHGSSAFTSVCEVEYAVL
jgi:hypothetical protein